VSIFERLFQASVDGVLLTRPTGEVLRANAAACAALGRSEGEICRLGRPGLVVEDERLHQALAARSHNAGIEAEITFLRPDGSTFVADFTSGFLPPGREADDGPLAYVIFRDATARRRDEERLRRVSRALALLGACNELVVRATDEDALYRDLCEAVVRVGGHLSCWVGRPADDEHETIRVVARAGDDGGYLDAIAIHVADTPRGRGPAGVAWRSGEPSVSRDIATDPRMEPWRETAARFGIRSAAALPVVHGGERFGLLVLYADAPGPFDDDEVGVLRRLADDLAYGVASLRERAARERADRARRESAALLRAITDTIPEPIFLKDEAGRWTFANPATLRVVGRSTADEVLGKTDAEIYGDAAIGAAIAAADRRVMASGSTEVLEERVLGPEGERTFLSTKSAFRDGAGRVAGLVGCAVDITDRLQAEADRERLARAIEQAAETVMITDARGAIVYVNPAFEVESGYSAEEVLGKNPRLLKSGAQGAEVYKKLWETIAAGATWQGRLVNRRKDGARYTIDVTITPVRDAAGAIASYVAVRRDVTRQLELEAELHQAQKLDTVGRLAAGVAHDFNNLLSVILGCGELALAGLAPGDPTASDVEEIVGAARRGAALTRQLLTFTQKHVARPERVDVARSVSDLERMLRRVLREDVKLRLALEPGLGAVLIDPAQLEQVLVNLVVNARDALPGGGLVAIAASAVELGASEVNGHAGPHVRLTVTDDGVGMDEATRAHIFEPFFTTKGPGKGTGLGLSTVYGIVRQAGGRVAVWSAPGLGTTFTIDLPCTPGSAGRASDTPTADAPHARPGEVVLVVEDEAGVRRAVTRLLGAVGYRVVAAGGGAEALRFVRDPAASFDLLLTDVVMPDLGGVALAALVRAERPGAKVLFMSGYSGDALGRDEAGRRERLVPKPIDRATLLRAVREVIDAPA
jgi:PAS domain S-box-containing protein